MNWTPERDKRLRELVAEGYGTPTIAKRLQAEGFAIGRGGVRGRLARIGLESDGQNSPAIAANHREYRRLAIPLNDGDRLVTINDMQFPFHDEATLQAVDAFLLDLEPTIFVIAGDGTDFYELSHFDKNPARGRTLQDELDISGGKLKRWRRRHPKARRVYIEGNHEDRLRRWLWQHPGVASLRSLDLAEQLDAKDDWEFLNYGSQVEVAGYLIEHGDVTRGHAGYAARAMFEKRGMSGVCGHTHRFGVYTRRDARGHHTYIENGCLCLLNPEYVHNPDWTQAFTYGIAYGGELYLNPVRIRRWGFRAEGRWYRRNSE